MITILVILAIIITLLLLDNSGRLLGLIISIICTLIAIALGVVLFMVIVHIGINL
jgi:hypothetical protein